LLLACAATALAFSLYTRVELRWFWLGWIGLTPWIALLERTRPLGGTVVCGLVMSAAFVLAVFGWFVDAIAGYVDGSRTVALLLVFLGAPLLQPQFLAFALIRRLARRLGSSFWPTALCGALGYVGSEWALPKVFGDTIGHGFYASPTLRQAADLAGAHGLTFILIVANECLLEAATRLRRRQELRHVLAPFAVVSVIAGALAGYGGLRARQLAAEALADPKVAAGLVQTDLFDYEGLRAARGTFGAVREILDAHYLLSREALARGPLDLLVWPETVYPTTFGKPKSDAGAELDREIAVFATESGVPLVFGAYDAEGTEEFNAAVVLRPLGAEPFAIDVYRKTRLFPLTERVPGWLDTEFVRAHAPWLGTWKSGSGPKVIPVGIARNRVVRIAPLICLDAVDPTLALEAVNDGAELLVTISNDAWFAYGRGPRLHLVVSAFRSLETRRPQLRATTTGISAVIDATGELLQTAGVHERAALIASVTPESKRRTLVLAWGDWFGPAAVVGTAALLGSALTRRRA
jgi:apolipoprotein N-acyltransferase